MKALARPKKKEITMKTKAKSLILGICLAVTLVAANVPAEARGTTGWNSFRVWQPYGADNCVGESLVKANIPIDFTAGDVDLSAGEYQIETMGALDSLHIRVEGTQGSFIGSEAAQANGRPAGSNYDDSVRRGLSSTTDDENRSLPSLACVGACDWRPNQFWWLPFLSAATMIGVPA